MNADAAWCGVAHRLLDEAPITEGGRTFRRMPGPLLEFTSTPLVTVRRCAWRNALFELEWLCYGNGAIDNLHPSARHWWERWAVGGLVNGVGGLDVHGLLAGVQAVPHSRRNVLTTYRVPHGRVPRNDFVLQVTCGSLWLDLFVYQRTCDAMRGMHHNWAQYWAIGLWLAARSGRTMRTLRWVAGDVHLYWAHADVARKCVAAPYGPECRLQYAPSDGRINAADFSLDRVYRPGNSDPLEYI